MERIQGKDVQKQLDVLNNQMLAYSKSENYSGANGIEIKHIKSFNETCVIMQQYVPKDPNTMTFVEFHQTLDIIKGQIKKNKKR